MPTGDRLYGDMSSFRGYRQSRDFAHMQSAVVPPRTQIAWFDSTIADCFVKESNTC